MLKPWLFIFNDHQLGTSSHPPPVTSHRQPMAAGSGWCPKAEAAAAEKSAKQRHFQRRGRAAAEFWDLVSSQLFEGHHSTVQHLTMVIQHFTMVHSTFNYDNSSSFNYGHSTVVIDTPCES